MSITIRHMRATDWPEVKEIYEEGIKSKNATFETQAPSYGKWMETSHPDCHLVVEEHNRVLAWAKVLYTSARPVYSGVGEVSIYVHPDAKGKGVGKRLLQELIKVSEENGFWTLKAVIFPENEASIKLHKSCGFREVGVHERLGKMGGVWRDNTLLEKRSTIVGVD
ncbi:N-acetyltransferase family protein [Paenisporosarcina quisquiliarum]|uniref:N-acetyltransferase family protein n=1 Tax=Paenisporosarcina quisquiliarum TaxID=365346 RepID=A0A9X3RDW2_9BACL|nr:GNAT family N-acetyltransferase [Paenisporosarcina quisquiliarum]MCZ8536867.1 N-acetyltransferase family protein [Paenisporosarcina quisquiliarum]